MLNSETRLVRSAPSPGGGRATPRAKQPRSEKQREAARRNGGKSRGPVTRQGKDRSRMNALTHGLLARVIAPPADLWDEGKLFAYYEAELTREYAPAGVVRRQALTLVASDMVQLARARTMREVQMRPCLTSRTVEQAQQLSADRRAAAAVRACHEALTSRVEQLVGAEDAGRAADELRRVLSHIEEDEADERAEQSHGAEPGAQPAGADVAAAGPELDEYERREEEAWQLTKATYAPIRADLADRDRAVGHLAGRVSMSAHARAAWGAATALWLRKSEERLRGPGATEVVEAYEAARGNHYLAVSRAGLPALENLARYERGLMRSIERGLARLARR